MRKGHIFTNSTTSEEFMFCVSIKKTMFSLPNIKLLYTSIVLLHVLILIKITWSHYLQHQIGHLA